METATLEVTGAPIEGAQWKTRVVHAPLRLVAHWLRETSGSVAQLRAGVTVDPHFRVALQIDSKGSGPGALFRVRARTASWPTEAADDLVLLMLGFETRSATMRASCESWEGLLSLAALERHEFEDVFGRTTTEAGHARCRKTVAEFGELRGRILRAALEAAESTCLRKLAQNAAWEPRGFLDVHLHLPMLEKRSWARRTKRLPECSVEAEPSGAVVLRPPDVQSCGDYTLHYNAALALSAGLDPWPAGEPYRLAFADERELDRGQMRLLLLPLLRAYGFSDQQLATAAGVPEHWERVRVQIVSSVSGDAAYAWLRTPRERSIPYYSLFAAASARVQRSLRLWLPYVRLLRDELFCSKDEAYALIVYRASRPFSRRNRPEFTYDPMNRDNLALATRNVQRLLARKLAAVSSFLDRRGLREDARHYDPDDAEAILKRTRCGNRAFPQLLRADHVAVEMLRKLGGQRRTWEVARQQAGENFPRNLIRAAGQVLRVFRTRFKRMSAEDDLSVLGNLVLVEATAAASEHYGAPAPVTMHVRLEDAAGEGDGGAVLLSSSFRAVRGGSV